MTNKKEKIGMEIPIIKFEKVRNGKRKIKCLRFFFVSQCIPSLTDQ